MQTLFFRLLARDDKEAKLVDAVACLREGQPPNSVVHVVDPDSFRQVPSSPFFYWVSERVRRLFRELRPLESDGRENRVGLQTSDNFRFLRCWWEVPSTTFGVKWFPYAKGGGYSPYYRRL